MTNVLLTATNPEDSSVVPVACNNKGELKLEEPIIFDGNLDGDLNVSGTSQFDGDVTIGTATFSGGIINNVSGTGYIQTAGSGGSYGYIFTTETQNNYSVGLNYKDKAANQVAFIVSDSSGDDQARIGWDGTAEFKGTVSVEQDLSNINGSPAFEVSNASEDQVIRLNNDGSVRFAGGKAGFTKNGELICTTQRGDLVILDNTSGGFGAWVEYVPTSRKDQVQEKLQEWSEKDKPAES